MKLKGLTISTTQLAHVMERAEARRESDASSDGSGRDGFISDAVLAETGTRYPGCSCESLGLRAGVRVTDMIALGAGCTASADRWLTIGGRRLWVNTGSGGHVCERLSAVRRAYGR